MNMTNRKIVKSNLADKVFHEIKAMVLSGEWEIGEKIPSEQVLSQMFGVSRLTVRIAIEKLNALRILETKVGEGTYVQPFDFQSYIGEIDDLMISDASIIDDVSAYRTAIELCAAEEIIKNPPLSASRREKLDSLCEQLEHISFDLPCDYTSEKAQLLIQQYVELDYTFHCKLCKYSENQLVYYSYLMARSPITRYLTLILQKRLREYQRDHPDATSVSAESFYLSTLGNLLHRSILNAIYEKDFALCQLIHKRLHSYTIDSGELN